MGERVVLETPCEHDRMRGHDLGDCPRHDGARGCGCRDMECSGGSRKVLEPAQPNITAAMEVLRAENERYRNGWNPESFSELAVRAVAAALEGLRLVKETD